MKAKELPSLDRLRELFIIDSTSPSGLRRVIRVGRIPAGAPAGTDSGAGYWKISVDGQQCHVHRILYALRYGQIPDGHLISHANLDGYDNRVENLRITAYSQGTRTRSRRANELCLPNGISKVGKYYRAQVATTSGPASKRGTLAAVTLWRVEQARIS
ncbi:HNH endonuclease signature motif containing protein [Pseudomonas marginalis]|uniref:HNH nuclease domain-containing protein n=1 Tax=Pseudomonas marginalis TaxID=298 RepID=A0A9X5QJ10_PSEMA|nr:HNH endonuclease signature motif containing protein [Pseudomonas marginalis]OAJ47769.1 hypothetical protein AO064_25760 [Pseudomonas marginalis]